MATELNSPEQDAHFHGSRKKETLPQPTGEGAVCKQEAAVKLRSEKEFIENVQYTCQDTDGFNSAMSDCRILAVLIVYANTHTEIFFFLNLGLKATEL